MFLLLASLSALAASPEPLPPMSTEATDVHAATRPIPAPPNRHRSTSLIVSGVAVLAAAYTPPLVLAAGSAASGNATHADAELGFIPIAGPVIWEIRQAPREYMPASFSLIIAADGLLQLGGAGLIVGGLATRHPVSWTPTVSVGNGVQVGMTGSF